MYVCSDTTFTVLWENVTLQDRPDAGNFTFEVTLCKNGDIIFVYKNIPNITNEITEEYHPVKVGLSDAYVYDNTVYCEFFICFLYTSISKTQIHINII